MCHGFSPLRTVLVVMLAATASLRAADDTDPGAAAAAVDPEAVKNLAAAYPPAPDGRERKVILLPHKERGEEDEFQVELVVGRTIVTDGINRYHFGGRLVERTIDGWGFVYYDVEGDLKDAASTRMGGPTNPAPRFVAGPQTLVRYNSRLPLVVMVPEGCELKWRVWRADPELQAAETR